MRKFSALVVVCAIPLITLASSPARALPTEIGFTGMVTQVDDPASIFTGLPEPSGGIAGSFVIDRDAGTVSFGDGTVGQTPPTGTGNVDGTYRYGAGGGGDVPPSVILFINCFVGTIDDFGCVPGQGGNAYMVKFPQLFSDGFTQSFVILLGGTDTAPTTVLPPPLASFETAEFLWQFSGGDDVAAVRGSINAIGIIAEPPSLVIFAVGILLAWACGVIASGWPVQAAQEPVAGRRRGAALG